MDNTAISCYSLTSAAGEWARWYHICISMLSLHSEHLFTTKHVFLCDNNWPFNTFNKYANNI
jgi:hypothetical protein